MRTQTVFDISRDDRARIVICSLRTATDRFKENYSIDDARGMICSSIIVVFVYSKTSVVYMSCGISLSVLIANSYNDKRAKQRDLSKPIRHIIPCLHCVHSGV